MTCHPSVRPSVRTSVRSVKVRSVIEPNGLRETPHCPAADAMREMEGGRERGPGGPRVLTHLHFTPLIASLLLPIQLGTRGPQTAFLESLLFDLNSIVIFDLRI